MSDRGLVLSLFPGADLFSRPFEDRGFCVVRGPEKLLAQDIRGWHAPAGKFDGLIGGPPCQAWSTATMGKAEQTPDMIPEFVRVVQEARPSWVVMENVRRAEKSPDIPANWTPVRFRDWDCGGLTMRKRTFWFWPLDLAMQCQPPQRRAGKPEYTLMASDWNTRRSHGWTATWRKGERPRQEPMISVTDAGRLQGFLEMAEDLEKRRHKKMDAMTKKLAITLLGNGVPRAMGEWVADAVVRWLESR